MTAATADFAENLTNFLETVRKQTNVPGISAGVSFQGNRITSHVGVRAIDEDDPIDECTEYHLGCITKLLVSIVVLELASAGKIDLSIPIGEYLPELKNTVHGKTVTMAHLLSHTSGYRGTVISDPDVMGMDWDDLVQYLSSAPQFFSPGTVYNYEHTEAVIAGAIVGRVVGRKAIEMVREDIFGRLNLRPGKVDIDSNARNQAALHLVDSSTGQFKRVKLAQVLMTGRSSPNEMWQPSFSNHTVRMTDLLSVAEYLMGQSVRIGRLDPLSGLTISLLQRPAVYLPKMLSGTLSEIQPDSFGLGAAMWSDGFYGIGGSTFGQCQAFRFDPRTGISVAVGLNVLQPALRDLIICRICESIAPQSPDRSAPDTDGAQFDFAELSGRFLGPGTCSAEVSIEEERLVIILDPGRQGLKRRVELVRDPEKGLVLATPLPNLTLAFFRHGAEQELGMMLGVMAYKRTGE